jgi:hypothetical protein
MPFVETRLISPTTLTTSAASALYTVPTGYSAIIKQLVVTNITGTAATFTFYIGAASAGNALFSGTSVAANDTVIINLSQVLTTGEILRALASTGSALNLTVSGVLNDGPLASTATYIADNAITSAKIADGAIVNADINASAAIDQSKIASLTSDLALKAPLASPTLTGTPLAPTANSTTNNTQIATTGFVTTAVSNIRVGAVPNFLVYFSGGNGTVTNGAYLAYNTESYDDTNNVVSGVFTVPAGQAGVYQFNVAANCYNIGSSGYFRIQIVTTAIDVQGSQTPAQGGSDVFSIASATLKLAVGDTVRTRWNVPATGLYSAGISYNNFSGVRIA